MHRVKSFVLNWVVVLVALTIAAFASYGLSEPISHIFVNLYTKAFWGLATFWVGSVVIAAMVARIIPSTRNSLGSIVRWSAIISAIPIFVFYSHVPALDRGAQKRTIAEMRTIVDSLESFRKRHGSYPSADTIEVLERFTHTPLPRKDAWGTPFFFSSTANGYTIVSFGNDGKRDTIEPVGATIEFSKDIVLKDGELTAFPEGMPK